MRFVRQLLLLAVVLLAIAPPCAHALPCPADTLQGSVATSGRTAITAADTVGKVELTATGYAPKHVLLSFDLLNGAFAAQAARSGGFYFGGDPAYGQVQVHERYQLLGPDTGAMVSFTATLAVQASSSGSLTYYGFGCGDQNGVPPCVLPGGIINARFSDDGGHEAHMTYATDGSQFQSLAIPLTVPVGGTFELSVWLSANGGENCDWNLDVCTNGIASATAILGFSGVPDEDSIVGCHGYAFGHIVPTRKSSWGSLKVRYR